MDGAEAGAVAEVTDDDAGAGDIGCEVGQAGGDELVGQAVEAVAAHTGIIVAAGQAEGLDNAGLTAVEGGVEAGDLRQMRGVGGDGADRCEVVRLVQRGERDQLFKLRQDRLGDQDGGGEVQSAVDDAVAEGNDLLAAEEVLPGLEDFPRGRVVGEAVGGPGSFEHRVAAGVTDFQGRGDTDLFDLAAQAGRAFLQSVDGELDAG